jgi:hypothetical protein
MQTRKNRYLYQRPKSSHCDVNDFLRDHIKDHKVSSAVRKPQNDSDAIRNILKVIPVPHGNAALIPRGLPQDGFSGYQWIIE